MYRESYGFSCDHSLNFLGPSTKHSPNGCVMAQSAKMFEVERLINSFVKSFYLFNVNGIRSAYITLSVYRVLMHGFGLKNGTG